MTAVHLSPVAISGSTKRPRSLLGLTRPSFDRILPSLFFASMAMSRCLGLVQRPQRGPMDQAPRAAWSSCWISPTRG